MEGCDVTNITIVAILAGILDFTKKSRNQVKTAINGNFVCLTCKTIHKWALCTISSTSFTFIVERSWKNMHFHSKMDWPPATYDAISKLVPNKRTAAENVRCWCFIVQEKTQKNLRGGGATTTPPKLLKLNRHLFIANWFSDSFLKSLAWCYLDSL